MQQQEKSWLDRLWTPKDPEIVPEEEPGKKCEADEEEEPKQNPWIMKGYICGAIALAVAYVKLANYQKAWLKFK